MKRLLSLLMMWVVTLHAFATFVCTFDPAVDKDPTATYGIKPYNLSKDGVDVSVSKGSISTQYYVPKGSTMTVSTQTGQITGMIIEFAIIRNYGPDGFVSSTGDYTVTEEYGIWQGQSQSVAFKAEFGYIYIKKLTVYIDGDGTMIYTPRISPQGGDFYDPVEVTMFCPIPGSVIHYTTDGSDPTTASPVYDSPITVNENCTVSALAVNNNQESEVQRQAYNFRQHEFGLGDLQGCPNGMEVTLDFDATVLYKDYYVTFLKDETGYAALNIDHTGLNDGDVIKAGYRATKTTTNLSMPELKDATRLRTAPYPNQPIARQVSIRQLGSCMPGEFVVLRDVTLNPYSRKLTDAQGYSCGVYQEFYFPTVVPNGEYEYEPDDEYVIVLNSNLVYLTRNIHYYGLGYDFSGLRDDDEVRLSFNTTVLYQHGDNLFVKDCTGYGQICGLTSHTYAPGDIISPEIFTQKSIVDGEIRLTLHPRYDIPDVKGFESVEPEEIGVDDMGHGYWAHYVVLRDVTVSALDNGDFIITDAQGNTCYGRNSFEQALTEGYYQELNGIVDCYQSSEGSLVYGLLPIANNVTEVSTLNEVYALEGSQIARFTEPLTVVYHNGPMLYVADKEGRQGLFYCDQYTRLRNGDLLRDVVCHWSTHDFGTGSEPLYITVILPVGNLTASGKGEAIGPAEISVNDITPDMMHHYVKIRDLKSRFYRTLYDPITNYGLEVDNEFLIDIPSFISTKWYDVTGFVGTEHTIFPLEIIQHNYPTGDVNGDNEVNISDIGAIIHAIESASDTSGGGADVNGDGEVNISDVNHVLNIILK